MALDAPISGDGLQRSALDHLWLHFTDMGAYADPAELRVMVRGHGCYLEDSAGRRYLDALAGPFSVNIGYGFGGEMGAAAAAQMRELPFAINWTFAHPRSIELAAELGKLAPGDLNHSFFVSGGSEAVEAAWKLVITGFGRLGEWFACDRFGVEPACAKGLSSAYAAIGALIASERVMEPFRRPGAMYTHGTTFGGHPVQAAVALRNIEIMRREGTVDHVRATEADFPAALEPLLELPIVGDLRGARFFYALELVKDKYSRTTFSDDECDRLLRGFLSPRLFERGLLRRADDRAEPVVQISPPLVARQEQCNEIADVLGTVLEEASDRMAVRT